MFLACFVFVGLVSVISKISQLETTKVVNPRCISYMAKHSVAKNVNSAATLYLHGQVYGISPVDTFAKSVEKNEYVLKSTSPLSYIDEPCGKSERSKTFVDYTVITVGDDYFVRYNASLHMCTVMSKG